MAKKAPDSTLFQKAYKALNLGQKQAVDALEGPVMVIAGPGTGKTQILTLRIANILRKTDTPPDAVLALTFTESGASAMRTRLFELIGPAAYRVNIYTFHGYATDVIARHPEAFSRIIGSVPIDEAEQLSLIREALANADVEALYPAGNPDFYIPFVRQAIGALKSDAYDPDAYEQYLDGADQDEKNMERSRALHCVYREYEKLLRKKKFFDFSDMLIELVRALEDNEDLRLELGESAQYILADEHQDANRAQNRILELLSSFHENPNLFIVGDEKQAIFRFQGASLENFLYFKRKYKKAKMIALEKNYRSTQSILDASHSMIGAESDVERPRLEARSGKGSPIEIAAAQTEDDETVYVALRIKALIGKKTLPEDIAIIVRRNADADAFLKMLRREKIPSRVVDEQSALDDARVQDLIMVLRAVNDLDNTSLLRALMLPGFGITTDDIFSFTKLARTHSKNAFSLLVDEKALRSAGITQLSQFRKAHAFFESAARDARRNNALTVFDEIVAESGFLSDVMEGDELEESLEAYRTLRSLLVSRVEREKSYKLIDFISLIDDLISGGVRLKVDDASRGKGVSILTAHKSKGLEYQHVFVARATESRWSPRKNRTFFLLPSETLYGSDQDDERRLFYVALTRAKVHAIVSYARTRSDGKEEQLSQFALEIAEAHKRMIEIPQALPLLPETKVERLSKRTEREREKLVERFFEQGLSATALNNYIDDPWKFFFRNLLQLPEPEEAHQLYGSSIHEALERFYNGIGSGKKPNKKDLIDHFVFALEHKPFAEESQKKAYLARGKKSLSGYFDARREVFSPAIRTEVRLSGTLSLKGYPSIELHGFLDRIKRRDDGTLLITDYKTGKPQSRNEIEGKTKNSTGAYKRQLVFYRLLVDLQDSPDWQFGQAELDFTEPTPSGAYKCETFLVTDEEIETLKSEIAAMFDGVRSLSFLNENCESEDPQLRALSEVVRKRLL